MERISLKKVTRLLSNTLRSPSTPVDGTQPSNSMQDHHVGFDAQSNASLRTVGSAERGESDAGHAAEHVVRSPTALSSTISVVVCGETGVGKSSVVNLIAGKELAPVSAGVDGCTLQSTRYDIPFDGMSYSVFDTIGLDEPQLGISGYLRAIEKAYELIAKLSAAGGMHLMLFCIRGGRITSTTQSNYRLFRECLCSTKVPIALVFTGLEREVEMEDWWKREKTNIEGFGWKNDGHACITAFKDGTAEQDAKYMESQRRVRELLKGCALKNDTFSPEPQTWFARFARGMKAFIEKRKRSSLRRKDIMKVLTSRCQLDPDTASRITDMIEEVDKELAQAEP